ncbi:hypothetical protein [Sphingopyxis sp. L1A2A]|uniref:hypothetical protein n=1 Tax=Sphingopyxis sp. L1A2A TaxID=2502247 RepID=UPI0010F86722|nr:hypothetical protein [Sphingopyxis sp. L1A2A]
MKALYAVLLAAAATHAPAAFAAPSPTSPLLGVWSVDVAKLTTPPAERPKSVTITYSDAGAGQWRTHVKVVLPDGKAVQATSTYTPDGTATPVEGNLEADMAATRLPEPGVMVTALARGGQPGSMRTYTVAADGQTMSETVVFFTAEGVPAMRTNYFNRVR